MKTIKIRFIEKISDSPDAKTKFLIQTKNIFGFWKYITYTINMGYGSICNYYIGEDKNKLLDEVLEKHFETIRKFVIIEEYPSVKIY